MGLLTALLGLWGLSFLISKIDFGSDTTSDTSDDDGRINVGAENQVTSGSTVEDMIFGTEGN
ncbi:MAG: hypothetical protein QGI70_11165, partial [Paracoccaceae bacterium]|nr:hypothetical protein [Paracoccaceae bacterium]